MAGQAQGLQPQEMDAKVPEGFHCCGTSGKRHQDGVCFRLLHSCLICKFVQVMSPLVCAGGDRETPTAPTGMLPLGTATGPLCGSSTFSHCFSFSTVSPKQFSTGPQSRSLLLLPRELDCFFPFLFSKS